MDRDHDVPDPGEVDLSPVVFPNGEEPILPEVAAAEFLNNLYSTTEGNPPLANTMDTGDIPAENSTQEQQDTVVKTTEKHSTTPEDLAIDPDAMDTSDIPTEHITPELHDKYDETSEKNLNMEELTSENGTRATNRTQTATPEELLERNRRHMRIEAETARLRRNIPIAGEEDDVPLHERYFEEPDDDGQSARDIFDQSARAYLELTAKRKPTDPEDIAYRTLVKREIARRTKIIQDRQETDDNIEESMFIPATMEVDEDDGDKLPDTSSKKRKRSTKGDQLAIDNVLSDERDREEESQKRVKRTPRKQPSQKNPKKPRVKKGPVMFNARSLMGSSVFQNATALQDGEDPEPMRMSGRRKDEALKNLLASLPPSQQLMATHDTKALNEASKKFYGRGSCRIAADGLWFLKGLQSTLKPFQLLGAAWMVEREDGSSDPAGGLCCDQMGLGKTIMSLAMITSSLRMIQAQQKIEDQKDNPRKLRKTTLIVVPSSLLRQWRDEIAKHCDPKLVRQVLTWTGRGSDASDPEALLMNAEIVLTTHHTVMSSCKKIPWPPEVQTDAQREDWLKEHRLEFRGILHQVEFYRVLIDEAHAMKNYSSQTSLGMRELKAKYRWGLTGTPLHNSPMELYPYFKFLQIPFTGDRKVFTHNYAGPKGTARLAELLSRIMMRRTYDDKLMGQAIVKLPATSSLDVPVRFNPLEREVYQMCHDRTIESINNDAKNSRLNMHNVLARISRLRQVSAHIFLVLDTISTILTPDDFKRLEKLAKAQLKPGVASVNHYQIRQLRQFLLQKDRMSRESSVNSDTTENVVESDFGVGKSHGLTFKFQEYLQMLKDKRKDEEVDQVLRCSFCGTFPPVDPMVTSCLHQFCATCLDTMAINAAVNGIDRATCTACDVEFAWSEKLNENNARHGTPRPAKPLQFNSRKRDRDSENPERKDRKGSRWAWIKELDTDMLPSAKTIAIKAQVLNWRDEDPKCKIIIFIQWIGMIHILSKIFEEEEWASIPFHGGMSLEQRSGAIDKFDKHEGPCIMLASLKCGGVGLNLTMASKAIIVDVWWNLAVEDQAFGRIFRIGQENETSLRRLFAINSIDENIHNMQRDKQAQIQAVMDRKEKGNNRTIKDLLSLFGNVKEHSEGGTSYFVVGHDRPQEETVLEDQVYQKWEK